MHAGAAAAFGDGGDEARRLLHHARSALHVRLHDEARGAVSFGGEQRIQRSEQTTREWIGAGLDLDLELLNLVRSEHFAFTRFGRYLQELRVRFSGPVVVDMFCLLRLELELSVQAKAALLARESGLLLPIDSDLTHSFREIEYLRTSIGRTGLLALKPLQVTSGRDLWHRHLLAS